MGLSHITATCWQVADFFQLWYTSNYFIIIKLLGRHIQRSVDYLLVAFLASITATASI